MLFAVLYCKQAREENRAKEESGVIHSTLLGPLNEDERGCLGRRWVAVISSKMKAWSAGGGHCWKIFSRQLLLPGIISRDAATGSCLQTHKSLMLPFQQLHTVVTPCVVIPAAAFDLVCIHSESFKGVCNMRCVLYHLPAAMSVRHSVSQTFSMAIQFFPSTLVGTWIFCFLSHGKGSKHKPHMVQTHELWKNPTILWVGELKGWEGEKKAERGEKEIDLAGNSKGSWPGQFFHNPAHTHTHIRRAPIET